MTCARLLVIGFVYLSLSTPAFSAGPDVRVMTMNQYLGADLSPVLTAPTPAAFVAAVQNALAQIAANDFLP